MAGAVVPPASVVSGSRGSVISTPRMLNQTETHQDITAWSVHVKNSMRKDESFYPFVNIQTVWDMTKDNFGLEDEHGDSKLKRKKEEMAEDLTAFLEIMAGYVPEDHLRMKILQDSTSFKSVIEIIREFYGAEINPETELDFMKLQRKPQEPYRHFYERLSSHCRMHLLPKNITVGGITTGDTGDKMTCSHMNLVAQVWLWKINPKLADLVKKEYGSKLQGGKALCELVPDIAKNIDNLLKGGDVQIQKVSFEGGAAGAIRRVLNDATEDVREDLGETEAEELEQEAINKIRKVFSGQRRDGGPPRRSGGRDRRERRGGENRDRSLSGRGYRSDRSESNLAGKKRGGDHCAHCEYARKVYGVKLDTKHYPTRCPNRASIKIIMNADQTSEDGNDFEGDKSRPGRKELNLIFQTKHRQTEERRVPPLPEDFYQHDNVLSYNSERKCSRDVILADLSPSQLDSYAAEVRRVVGQNLPKKKRSPAIQAKIKGETVVITIDEGAEMNIISAKKAADLKIPITKTKQGADAADGNGLRVIGQTLYDLCVVSKFQGVNIELDLGRALVVEGLAADILMGEPGKRDNALWTKASESRVYLNLDGVEHSTPYYRPGGGKDRYGVMRVNKSMTIEPGDSVNVEVPSDLQHATEVVVNARRTDKQWFEPRVRRVVRGRVNIKNITDKVVRLTRGKPFAELRLAEEEMIPTIKRVIYEDDDNFRYERFAKKREPGVSYLSECQVDPDNIMPGEWKLKFKKLLEEFDEVIDPAPGKYNGCYGDSDTVINFCDVPPPIEKVYTPAYSLEMQKALADKMDKLIDWGVLVKAEDIGVSVEHIAPSLLVPKNDGDGYRMVNDYSRLNNFIGKAPSTSPTMQDVKNAIARKKLVVHLDLSNYFYQGGMRRADAQFLGVIHPFNGLYCYVCEPQGLRNASEHAYDRLGKIFGDMVRKDELARHADGLHVLGDTFQELYRNFLEVLLRLRNCGMTLKPSKVIVAPLNSVLFGWKLEGTRWIPTEHTTSALANCEKPSTVKKMRSFLGAFKQFTDLVPDYAVLLHPLEKVQAGRGSGEKIEWTAELTEAFAAAQKATGSLEAITNPRPSDKLHTFSDFSQEKKAVGGRLLIEREEDGKTVWLLAGHYSATIDQSKSRWLPCEGEAAGIKMTLSHFTPWIIESSHFTTHHTDNQPCVQAWRRLKKGAYSNSSRISSFLSELSMLPVNLVYKPGKEMHSSDFSSRHPARCSTPDSCQICKFAREIETIGDKSALIRSVTVEDIKAGKSVLPLTQRKTWVDVQMKDSAIQKFRNLVRIGQSPNKHKTKGEHTIIKKLYRLYVAGDVQLDTDGAVLVKAKDGAYSGYAMVVPTSIYPGLMHTLHLRLDHPSKAQLTALTARYFYCHGYQGIIDQVTEGCLQCASVKKLPKVLLQDTTEGSGPCGLKFSADVMEQRGQKLLLVRESLTQFTWATLIEDQKADTLETALLTMILPFTPSAGAVVRTDGGTGFQSLAARSDTELKKRNIQLEIGRLHNSNKNPQAENTVKEFEKEMLRYDQDIKLLRNIDICHILKSMNTRIRYQGLSSQEMFMKRDMIKNEEIEVNDTKLSDGQKENRTKQSEYQATFQSKSKKKTPPQVFKVGQFVFIRNTDTKLSPRELHVVCDLKTVRGKDFVVVRKAQYQLRHKTYLLRPEELIPAPIVNTLPETDVESDDETDLDVPDTETEPETDVGDETDVLTESEPEVEEEIQPEQRPRRRSADRARELFSKVLRTEASLTKKKRKVNPCLENPYEENNIWLNLEEHQISEVRARPHLPVGGFPPSRAAEDIGGLSLLSDSFEDDNDFSLSLLNLAFTAEVTEAVEREEARPALEDHLNAPPGNFMGVSPSARLVERSPQVSAINNFGHLTNPGPLHGTVNNTDTEYETENDENETVDDHLPLEDNFTTPPGIFMGVSPSTSLAECQPKVSVHLTPGHLTNPDFFPGTSSTSNTSTEDNVFEDASTEVNHTTTACSDFPTERVTVASQVNKTKLHHNTAASALSTGSGTPRVARPTSLGEVSLGRTQDLGKVLKQLHEVTPPAPPPVDRTRKSVIKSSRDLRPRTESLNYAEINKGRQLPSWRDSQ